MWVLSILRRDIKTLELMGKHLKMFTYKLEVRVIRTLDDLTEEKLESLIADIRKR